MLNSFSALSTKVMTRQGTGVHTDLNDAAGGLTKSFLEIRLPYVRLVHYPGSAPECLIQGRTEVVDVRCHTFHIFKSFQNHGCFIANSCSHVLFGSQSIILIHIGISITQKNRRKLIFSSKSLSGLRSPDPAFSTTLYMPISYSVFIKKSNTY